MIGIYLPTMLMLTSEADGPADTSIESNHEASSQGHTAQLSFGQDHS
jgi:hypothetical protein